MPAPLTNVAIVNRALAVFGGGVVATMQDATPPGPSVAAVYETAMLGLLAEYPWSFTFDVRELVRLADETPDASGLLKSGWRYAYQLPADRLAPPDKYLNDPRDERAAVTRFRVANDRVYCDEEKLYAMARFRPDEAVWPPYFVSAAIAMLAAELVMPISGNATLRGDLEAKAVGTPSERRNGGLLGLAKQTDARNSGTASLGVANLVHGWRNG